jgi:hypothetical protein
VEPIVEPPYLTVDVGPTIGVANAVESSPVFGSNDSDLERGFAGRFRLLQVAAGGLDVAGAAVWPRRTADQVDLSVGAHGVYGYVHSGEHGNAAVRGRLGVQAAILRDIDGDLVSTPWAVGPSVGFEVAGGGPHVDAVWSVDSAWGTHGPWQFRSDLHVAALVGPVVIAPAAEIVASDTPDRQGNRVIVVRRDTRWLVSLQVGTWM